MQKGQLGTGGREGVVASPRPLTSLPVDHLDVTHIAAGASHTVVAVTQRATASGAAASDEYVRVDSSGRCRAVSNLLTCLLANCQ